YLQENSPSKDKTFKVHITPFIMNFTDSSELTNRSWKINGSQFLHENSPNKDKTFKNGRHELLNEVEETASVVYKDILDWI
ncbi:unnamed protein product, partial [Porites evermanni]